MKFLVFIILFTPGINDSFGQNYDSLQKVIIANYTNAKKEFLTDISAEKITVKRWDDCPCFNEKNNIGYNVVLQYYLFKKLYEIELLAFKNKSGCLLVFDNTSALFLFEHRQLEMSSENIRVLKGIFKIYDTWITKIEKNGLKYIIKNKIDPFSNTRYRWKDYFGPRKSFRLIR